MKLFNNVLWHCATPLFLAVLALSMWGILGFDTPMNAPFVWSWKHLAIPILGIGWLYGYFHRNYFLSDRRVPHGKFWFSLVAVPPIALLFSAGIVSLVNGSFPTERTVTYSGPITKLYISGGRLKECQADIIDSSGAGQITLGVSSAEYSTLQVGQNYERKLRIGLLGIPYRSIRERR